VSEVERVKREQLLVRGTASELDVMDELAEYMA